MVALPAHGLVVLLFVRVELQQIRELPEHSDRLEDRVTGWG